jgi:Flp pilus assembly pilin Flp
MPRSRWIGRTAVDLWQETSGAVALEYGLIAALIAVAILGSIVYLGETLFGLPLQSLIDAFVGMLS